MFDNDTEISLPPGTPPTSMSPDLYLKDPLLNINKKVWRTVVLTPSSTCRLQVVYSCFFSFVVLDAINDKMKEDAGVEFKRLTTFGVPPKMFQAVQDYTRSRTNTL